MSKRNIGKEILAGLEEIAAWRRGEIKLNTREYKTLSPKDIVRIRERLGLTQEAFAALMNVSARTLQEWEQGRRTPRGPAHSLLRIAQRHPEALLR